MNDFKFGNYMYKKRMESGLSQSQVARLLGISDKAVSKWENGKAKPRTATLRRLAELYQISLEDLLNMKEEEPAVVSINKIVITGGPGAGKTIGMSWIQNEFTKLGYTVLFVPETATELITGGVAPWTCGSNIDFQTCQMTLQLEKERIFEQAARTMDAAKILIVCDRGAIDNKAYMDDLEFSQILKKTRTTDFRFYLICMKDYSFVKVMTTSKTGGMHRP